MNNVVISLLCLIVGLTAGWFFSEKYQAFISFVRHDFEELFEKNPHPELFTEEGKIDRGDYIVINFPPDYDPENDEYYIDLMDEEDEEG